MLIVHPSSTCDVCLDGYNWSTPANAPHAIACGHVFCLACLRALHPSNCPLCRKAFQPDRIKKLHVDRLSAITGEDDSAAGSKETELLQRVALFFGENTPDEDVNSVMGDANQWLATRSNSPATHRPLRSAVAALQRYRILQQESRADKVAIEALRQELVRKIHIKDRDLETAQTIEGNLVAQLTETQEKLAQAQSELESLRGGRSKGRHEQRSTPYAPAFPPLPTLSNPLPDPPRAISPLNDVSIPQLYAQSVLRTASMPENAIGNFTHPYLDPPSSSDTEDEEPRRSRSVRPPVIIPGASSTQRVVPPQTSGKGSSRDHRTSRRNDTSYTHSSAGSIIALPSGLPGTAVASSTSGSSSRSHHQHQAQYHFPPQGHGWYAHPVSQRLSSSMGSTGSTSATGSFPMSGSSHTDTAPRLAHPAPSTQGMLRTLDGNSQSESDRDQRSQRTWDRSRRPSTTQSSSTAVLGGATAESAAQSASVTNPNTSSMTSNTSLASMSLLGPPQSSHSRRPQTYGVDRREIMDLIGVSAASVQPIQPVQPVPSQPSPMQPSPMQPSPASTWGTIRSSQVSTNSSLGNLGLVGLPDPPAEPVDETEEGDSPNLSRQNNVIDEDAFMTPRRPPLSSGRSPEQPLLPPSGRGLGLAPEADRSTGSQTISTQEDLHIVSESLRRLMSEDGRESRTQRLRLRRSPSPATRQISEPIIGARTGIPLYSSRPASRPVMHNETSSRPTPFTRTYSENVHREYDRGSISDTEHIYNQGHRERHRPQDSSHHRRQNSSNAVAVIPPPPPGFEMPRRDSASRASYQEHGFRFELAGMSSRNRRSHHPSHTPAPSISIDATSSVSSLGQSSLLLSFNPPTTASAAVTARGEDAAIHAPRPVSSRNNNMFGAWNSHSSR